LRYFNACGADPHGEIGECHNPETHLIPRALMAAAGTIPHLAIFGGDYQTPDGTCIRDYIHVWDLARAHLRALHHLMNGGDSLALNLGSGRGVSIREIITAIERITCREVPVVIEPRRDGDPPILYAESSRAEELLRFRAELSDIDTIVRTAAPFFGLLASRSGSSMPQAGCSYG
jgi:UDP-arabinose 4-epimerase